MSDTPATPDDGYDAEKNSKEGYDLAIAELRTRTVAETNAGKAAVNVHGYEQAETIAKRIKDASALEKALLGKLECQRDFAKEYRVNFPVGAPKGNQNAAKNKDASTGVIVSGAEAWCLSHGFTHRTVQRWCDLLDTAKFTARKNSILKRCWELAELWQAANFSSESVEWYTPARYLEAVHEVLGEIDLDPASNLIANATVRAKQFFSQEHDGLVKEWHGRVFMNPPYGKTADGDSLAGAFCDKAISEYEGGNVSACIILINSLHSQNWQAPLYGYPVCFVDHRIQFISGDGQQNKNPTFQNIFVYLGVERERFAHVFSRFGYVMERVNV